MIRVPPAGSINAKIALVGEAPGKEEVSRLQPFVGASGRKLNSMLYKAGLTRAETYITNVVKERPPGNDISTFVKIPNTANGTVRETQKFAEYVRELRREVSSLPNLKVIVAVGKVAMYALTGYHDKITKRRGSIYNLIDKPEVKVIPIIHPSATLRRTKNNRWYEPATIIDLAKVKEIAYKGIPDPLDVELLINPTIDQIFDFMNYIISDCDEVGFDIETIASSMQMSCFSLSDGKTSMSVPLWNGTNLQTLENEATIIHLLGRILEGDTGIIAHNIVFDAGFMFHRYGIVTRNFNDTMIMQGVANPGLPKGLDFVTSVYTNIPYYKEDRKTWLKVGDVDMFWRYNATDSAVLHPIKEGLSNDLTITRNWDAYKRHIDIVHPLIYMQERGFKVDMEGLVNDRRELKKKVSELEEEFKRMAGSDINIQSSKDIIDFLYRVKGYTTYVNKDTGRPTADKTSLKRLSRKGAPEAKILLEIRKLKKLIGTYLDINFDSGRLKCSFNPIVSSGRLSSSKNIFGYGTNMQNIPHSVCKRLIPDDGYLLVEVDLSQAENRIVAYISDERKLIEAFKRGEDVHSLTASLIFNKPPSEISREDGSSTIGGGTRSERYWGKTANHAFNYLMGYKSFALQYEISEVEAKRIRDAYFKNYPNIVKNFHHEVERQLAATHEVRNCFGRLRRFIGSIDKGTLATALNFIPQSTVAEIINKGLKFAYDETDFELLNQVHDSLVLQIRIDLGLKRISENILKLVNFLEMDITWKHNTFVLPCSVEVGFSFKHGTEIHSRTVEGITKELEKIV